MIGRDLLGIEDLDRDDIVRILDTAERMREVGDRVVKKVPTLRGRTVVNLFFEASTRTRASFESRESKNEAGQDRLVHVPCATRVGAYDIHGAEGPRPRHHDLDVSKAGEEVTSVVPVAAVSLAPLLEFPEATVHATGHPLFQDLCDRPVHRSLHFKVPTTFRIHLVDVFERFR